MEKMDRRIKYTRRVLKENLVELLAEKPISKISIKELCARADINRSTFYAHYTDQYDLLNQIEVELFEDIFSHFSRQDLKPTAEALEHLFLYIQKNASLCVSLLGEYGSTHFQYKVMDLVKHKCLPERFIEDTDPIRLEYINLFVTGGGISVVRHWLKTGMLQPASEIAQVLMQLVQHGAGIA
ncbi:TetR/AcrR family transcriptional regulator [Christensenellaceae bacterium OttesenSCG-928-M15]|nr:TetR/AcrR family transcriptional regulator [Christensenellaceae bacterium OttesenSCG-928-M15]